MSSTLLPDEEVRTTAPVRTNPARYYYLGAALLLAAIVFLGFKNFYLEGKPARGPELFPPLRTLLIVHGIAMTGWVVLSIVQPLLIVLQRRQWHRQLGMIGACLAATIVVLGPYTAVKVMQLKPDIVRFGIHSKPFLAIQFGDMLIFATFVTLGVLNRKKPVMHRAMMLLATLGITDAATSRIGWLRQLHENTVFGHVFGTYFVLLVVGAVLLAVKTALTRSWDRYFAAGYAGLVVAGATITAIARTGAWERVVNSLF